ncbi:MAG: hypothetical protein ABJA02_14810, partial [Acidobacteriota bacterium]
AVWLKGLQEQGYRVSLIFLWLDNVELAIERVKERVRLGGHDIPEDTIRRRYSRGLGNLFDLYIPIADAWRIFDSSRKIPIEVVRFTEDDGETVFDKELWIKLRN